MRGSIMRIIIHLVEAFVWTDDAIHVGLVHAEPEHGHVCLTQDISHPVCAAATARESLDRAVLDAQPVQHLLPLVDIVELQPGDASFSIAEAYLISSSEPGDGGNIVLSDVDEAFTELDGTLGAYVVGSFFGGPGYVGFYVMYIERLAFCHHYPHGDGGIC